MVPPQRGLRSAHERVDRWRELGVGRVMVRQISHCQRCCLVRDGVQVLKDLGDFGQAARAVVVSRDGVEGGSGEWTGAESGHFESP